MPAATAHHPRLTLAACALGYVLVMLDVSVVNVALDALREQFRTDVSGLQWVLNAYTLVFAALLLTSGSLGDRFGARRVFGFGLVVFTSASMACGLAPSLPMLVGARVFQGLGAALLVPNSLSVLRQAFPDPEARNRAVGWWAAIGGMSLAAGPVIGGVLIAQAGWRVVFLINLPVGLVGCWMTWRFTRPAASVARGLDLAGQIAIIVALASLTGALTEASRRGWADPWVAGGLGLALAATLAFVRIESKARAPMLPLSLFRVPTFSAASLCGVVVNFAYYGLVFVFSLFFQVEQHRSSWETGLAFLPLTVVLVIGNIVAGNWVTRLGTRRLLVFGLLLSAAGYALMLPVRIDGSYALLVVPMLMAAGGVSLVVPTMTNATLSSVDASRAGVASGVLNSARQLGGMLGVAVFGYLVRDMAPQAFMRGLRESLAVSSLLLAGGALACWLAMREQRSWRAA